MTPILSRIIPALARPRALVANEDPAPEAARQSPARGKQEQIADAGLSSLYSLCEQIEAGYGSGLCMYDSGMTSLAERLTSSTGEIKHLIEQHARMRGILTDLHLGYDHFEVTGLECDDTYQELKRHAAAMVTDSQTVAHA